MTVLLVVAFLAVLSPIVQAQQASAASQSNEPAEKTFSPAEKIMGYDAPPPGEPTEESIRREKAAVQYPGNASMNYRGVVFDNFNATGSFGEEMVVDFGSLGIFVRDSTWNQISGLNPSWMISGTVGAIPSGRRADRRVSGQWGLVLVAQRLSRDLAADQRRQCLPAAFVVNDDSDAG